MSKRITVNYEGKPSYDIRIESSYQPLLEELFKFNIQNKKLCIVTESTVGPFYAEEIKSLLTPHAKSVIVFQFPAGEKNKNLDVVRNLYEKLILEHFDRNDILLALGGGVTGDLTGYTAATYLRGIDFIQIPTTLLSQVDSSIGGKTGVDFDAYKNMVGAFYQPKLVYMNLSALKTLTDREYLSGMGEIIKHGLIKDKRYYEWLKQNHKAILSKDYDALESMIEVSCLIKREVVEKDPKEKGDRALLNYGHTIGHAIEKTMNFTLLHGECIALGMVASSYLSFQKGYITKEELNDIIQTISQFNLPAGLNNASEEEIMEAVLHDKKMDSGVIKFILINKIGNAVIDTTITQEDMKQAIRFMKELIS